MFSHVCWQFLVVFIISPDKFEWSEANYFTGLEKRGSVTHRIAATVLNHPGSIYVRMFSYSVLSSALSTFRIPVSLSVARTTERCIYNLVHSHEEADACVWTCAHVSVWFTVVRYYFASADVTVFLLHWHGRGE